MQEKGITSGRRGLPLLGNDEFRRGIGVHRITVGMLHDFLLNVNSDLGRDFISGFSDGYLSVLHSYRVR
jgi:hypothetical protein